MNFFDVLAAEKWGGGIPTINFFDLLFAQSMGGGEQWKTYEGTLPATFNANGDDIVEGTTAPATCIPYGYEVDMSVSDGTTSTTTPIYIGDTALQKDGYVDYQAQKVYRMINGVLTPTDPPIPLPALPTCKGETVVDYAGGGTAPEKVYFEYQGGKQP